MSNKDALIEAKARLAAAQLSAALSLAQRRVAEHAKASGQPLIGHRLSRRHSRRIGPGGMEYACL
ncbi:MAG: hypothetical protein ACOZD0_14475 [Pseudomonadota bacterium]